MKKKPFNTNYPKPVEKVHVPNKIETNLEGFEKENFQTTMDEFIKSFPNPRITVGNDFIDNIFKDGVNKKDIWKTLTCDISICPYTYYCFMNDKPVTCNKCGKTIRGNSVRF